MDWRVDATHVLTFTSYTASTPERNYFAALIALQTSLFSEYLTSHSPWIEEKTIETTAYGVTIDIENEALELKFGVVSGLLGALGAFLQQRKVCEVAWYLSEVEPGGQKNIISTGQIEKARYEKNNGTGAIVEIGIDGAAHNRSQNVRNEIRFVRIDSAL